MENISKNRFITLSLCVENDTGYMQSKQSYTDSRDWLYTALSQILLTQ